MNVKHFLAFVIAGCLVFWAAGQEASGAPSAYLPKMHYESEPVLDGTDIIHDFILQNKGTEPLKIENVHAD